MYQGWAVLGAAFLYLLALFGVASYGDRKRRGPVSISRPRIYAFSLAIYCTTWTFFGSVGMAAANGLSFLAIYMGPILLITIGNGLVKRIVRLSKEQRITSVADFLGARYGKSIKVAGVAAVIAVIGTVPYIALQLKAVSVSVSKLINHFSLETNQDMVALGEISVLISVTLAVFTILFGTRHADATEHQDGLILAVALESVVKLLAFLSVGIFVTWFMFDGIGDLTRQAIDNERVVAVANKGFDAGGFAILALLSLLVFVLLPRQFHVTVVENRSEEELRQARWLFPAYLIGINLFVLPIAVAGHIHFNGSINADDFVLLLPLSSGNELIAMVAFIGGLSAGAAMVVVACVALAIMISNDLVLPLILRRQEGRAQPGGYNMEQLILRIRRTAIMVLLFLAYIYYRAADNSQALASIGIVSFAAISQMAPAFFGGLFWERGNARGAIAGMTAGIAVWGYTLLLPTLLEPDHWLIVNGPLGNGLLRPEGILGSALTPLANGVLWSLSLNSLFFLAGSLTRPASSSERIQAGIFVSHHAEQSASRRQAMSRLTVNELIATVSRYLGTKRTERAFESYSTGLGKQADAGAAVDPDMLAFSEQLLASAIGASSSRLVHTLLLKRFEDTSPANLELLDQASEALQYNRDVLQSALDRMDQGISVFDAEYRLAFWNRQFRKLLDLPASIGQAGISLDAIVNELFAVHDLASQGIEASELSAKIVGEEELWLLALSGSERILEIRTSPMPGGGLVVTWHDITERILVAEALREANETLERRVEERTSELVRANQKLERATRLADEANESKTRFLAAAGHDILQPLNAARLYASALQERLGDHKDGQLVQNVGKALESVEDILGAVLAISRLDTGRQETRIQAFPITRIFDQMRIEFNPVAQERGLDLRIVNSSLWLKSDPTLLRRLLQNLISNAIKYTPSGKVLVGCRRRGDNVSIEVCDTGIGMAEEDLASIFTEFRRLDAGAKQAPGLGLGLSIVQRIAGVLGHPVSVQSRQGMGTGFRFVVERAEAEISRAEPRPAEMPAQHSARLEDVFALCIDNDPSILEGMATLLSQWGCEVRTAADREASLNAIGEIGRAPDIVFADYHLDNETGIDVIDAIRNRHGADFPAVLVTADRTQSVKTRADAKGIVMLHKPVRPAGLRAILSMCRTSRDAAE